jgi:hypothetical protein
MTYEADVDGASARGGLAVDLRLNVKKEED